jgi:hypothetical protein
VLRSAINDTFLISGLAYCEAQPDTGACFVQQGGRFDGNTTSTSATYDGSDIDGNLPSESSLNSVWSDNIIFSSEVVRIPQFAFGVLENITTSGNVMGLGRNSSIANALIEAKITGSKVWSLFTGWTGDSLETQSDGCLVIDGYDLAKIVSESTFTQNVILSTACPSGLMIAISDVLVNYSNGSTMSLMDSTGLTDQNACLTVEYPLLDVSGGIWDSFQRAAGGLDAFVKSPTNSSKIAVSNGVFSEGMLGLSNNVYV